MIACGSPAIADFVLIPDSPSMNVLEFKSVPIDQGRLVDLQPAIDAFKAGDLSKFEEAYMAAEAKSNLLPHRSIFLSKLQIEAGRMDLAFNTLEQYLMRFPNDPEGYLALGEIALRSNRLTDAWLQFQHTDSLIRENKIRPGRLPLIQFGLIELMAATAERRQQFDEAHKQWDQMLKLKPEMPLAVWRKGRLKVIQGETTAGVELMRSAFAKDKQLPSPELVTALLLSEKPDKTATDKWFQEAIRLDENDPVRWSEYVKWLLLEDRFDEVQKAVSKLPADTMKNRDLRLLMGVAARYAGDSSVAEDLFAELHQESPEDIEVADQLAQVLVESSDEGKRARAFQLSESNLRRAPNQENTIATAAWVQFKLGDVDLADRLLGKLAGQTALAPQTAYYASEVLKARGRLDESRQVLQVAVDSRGFFPGRAAAKKQLEE